MVEQIVVGSEPALLWAEIHRRLRSHPLVMDHALAESGTGTYGLVVLRSERPVFPEDLDAILQCVHRGLPEGCRLSHLEIAARSGAPQPQPIHSSDQRTE